MPASIQLEYVVRWLESHACPSYTRTRLQTALQAKLAQIGGVTDINAYVPYGQYEPQDDWGSINVPMIDRFINLADNSQVAELQQLEATIESFGSTATVPANLAQGDVTAATNADWDAKGLNTFPAGETQKWKAYRSTSTGVTADGFFAADVPQGTVVISLVPNPSPTNAAHWQVLNVAASGVFNDVFA